MVSSSTCLCKSNIVRTSRCTAHPIFVYSQAILLSSWPVQVQRILLALCQLTQDGLDFRSRFRHSLAIMIAGHGCTKPWPRLVSLFDGSFDVCVCDCDFLFLFLFLFLCFPSAGHRNLYIIDLACLRCSRCFRMIDFRRSVNCPSHDDDDDHDVAATT